MIDSLPAGTLVAGDKRAGTVVVTGSPAELARASELVAAFDRSAEVASATFPMHFIKSAEAVKALSTTLAPALPSTLYASEQQNAVIASGPPAFIERARALVEQIDRPGRQVRYDVRVADLSPSESSNVGVVFGGVSLSGQATPGQVATAFVRNSLSLNATINALVTKGEASILAQPSLSTLNNVQASLLVGQQFPVVYFDARTGTQQVQFVNVGVNLTVSPSIGDDGAITTELQTDYSTIVNFVNNFPIIGTRKAQSTLRVMDGETIVIAGLFQELDAATISKVPILGDLPLFGELFKNRTRSHVRDEIVFMVTPHLVAEKKEAR
ncbi:MAG: hypothetical protein GIW95_01205 [Candidatus Eremiobacteraeota bacterium]|nr:hypothetical protein [Candidatus Eremiobacteraeota bacterium]